MKTPAEIIKEKYSFYDENYVNQDVELDGKQITELMIKYADQFKQVSVEPEVKVQIAEMVERHLIAHEQMKEQYLDKNLDMYNKAGGAILALEKLLKDLKKSNLSA